MPNTLEKLYKQFYKPSEQQYFQNLVKENHKQLISNLSKEDRKAVLKIIDSKDSIEGYHAQESFICGFQLAIEIFSELKHYKQEYDISETGDEFLEDLIQTIK